VLHRAPVELRPPPNALPDLGTRSDLDGAVLAYFGTAIRSERVRADMDIAQLARVMRQHRSTITMWESGRSIPRFTNIVRLLALFPGLVEVLSDLAAQLAEHAAEDEPNGSAA
jgi:transcriptional regulator with XRE-family HTH domain